MSDGVAEIVWLTHEASERAVKAALDDIGALEKVRAVANMIRVESL